MSATIEQIKKEIRALTPDEVDALLRDLQNEYVMPPADGSEADIEAEWDAEIAERVKDVEEGIVKLISMETSDLRIDALFAKRGLQRRSQ